jgi:hypothetical protein
MLGDWSIDADDGDDHVRQYAVGRFRFPWRRPRAATQ